MACARAANVPPDDAAPRVDDGALLDLASELVQLDTTNPPGGERAAAERVARFLDADGVDAGVQDLGDGRANLVARVAGRHSRAGVFLSGHLDTVPVGGGNWSVPPLGGAIRDGRLYGRGAVDMKGAVAAMAVAMRHIAAGPPPPGDVLLGLTAGEETDSFGATEMLKAVDLSGVRLAVIGEPTDLTMGIGHRGALWVGVHARGRAGHGSNPASGTNAVTKLIEWLHPIHELDALVAAQYEDPLGEGSASLNEFHGGTAPNVIPAVAKAVLDLRTLAQHDHAVLLAALRERAPEVELSVLRDSPAVATAAEDPAVAEVAAAVRAVTGEEPVMRHLPYTTDGSVFAAALGVPVIVIGPGSERRAHQDDEFVEVAALHTAAKLYERIARSIDAGTARTNQTGGHIA